MCYYAVEFFSTIQGYNFVLQQFEIIEPEKFSKNNPLSTLWSLSLDKSDDSFVVIEFLIVSFLFSYQR